MIWQIRFRYVLLIKDGGLNMKTLVSQQSLQVHFKNCLKRSLRRFITKNRIMCWKEI